MATFPATYYQTSTKYPNSGTRIQMGRSYTYTAPQVSPDQRIFTLSLAGMQYFVTNNVIDLTVSTERNMAVLDAFYREHLLYKSFDFNHPVYGIILCKFNQPLEIPKGIPGGNGVLEPFTVELIEIP